MTSLRTDSPRRFWNGFVMALGGLAAAGATLPADAAVLYSGPIDLTMSTLNDSITFDLDQSGTGPYALLNGFPNGGEFTLFPSFDPDVTMALTLTGEMAGLNLKKLSAGTTIDSALPWAAGLTYFEDANSGEWQGGADAYIGLRLVNGADYNYGWAHLVYDDLANTMTLKGFAVELVVNQAITAGDTVGNNVPEPGTLALAALGLGGMALRRRRAAAPAASA